MNDKSLFHHEISISTHSFVITNVNFQSCVQYLRSNESAVMEAVGLVSSAETVELFGENVANGSTYQTPRSSAVLHASNSNARHYPGTAHAQKRRASDNS